jgi:hypothetical protein
MAHSGRAVTSDRVIDVGAFLPRRPYAACPLTAVSLRTSHGMLFAWHPETCVPETRYMSAWSFWTCFANLAALTVRAILVRGRGTGSQQALSRSTPLDGLYCIFGYCSIVVPRRRVFF